MSDYLKFDGGKSVIAEVHSCAGSTYLDLSKVCAISSQLMNLQENTETVLVVFDGGFNLNFTLNVYVYDNLIDAWMYVKAENRPTGKRTYRGWGE